MINGITGLGFGIDCMVMQSSQDADTLIDTFEEYIKQGYDPNAIEQEVYRQTGINPDNLMFYDKERIQRKVEAAYAAHYNQRG